MSLRPEERKAHQNFVRLAYKNTPGRDVTQHSALIDCSVGCLAGAPNPRLLMIQLWIFGAKNQTLRPVETGP